MSATILCSLEDAMLKLLDGTGVSPVSRFLGQHQQVGEEMALAESLLLHFP